MARAVVGDGARRVIGGEVCACDAEKQIRRILRLILLFLPGGYQVRHVAFMRSMQAPGQEARELNARHGSRLVIEPTKFFGPSCANFGGTTINKGAASVYGGLVSMNHVEVIVRDVVKAHVERWNLPLGKKPWFHVMSIVLLSKDGTMTKVCCYMDKHVKLDGYVEAV